MSPGPMIASSVRRRAREPTRAPVSCSWIVPKAPRMSSAPWPPWPVWAGMSPPLVLVAIAAAGARSGQGGGASPSLIRAILRHEFEPPTAARSTWGLQLPPLRSAPDPARGARLQRASLLDRCHAEFAPPALRQQQFEEVVHGDHTEDVMVPLFEDGDNREVEVAHRARDPVHVPVGVDVRRVGPHDISHVGGGPGPDERDH